MSITRKKAPSIFLYLLLIPLVILGGIFWLEINSRPVNSKDTAYQTFVIHKGSSTEGIANRLKTANLINSPLVFKYVVAKKALSRQLQAGSFQLSPSMDTKDIALALTQGTNDVWIQLLEGWRNEEISSKLKDTLISSGTVFDENLFLSLVQGREGYVFPDTYLIPLTATEQDIAALLLRTFDEKVTQGLASDISQSSRSLDQIIIMASLIEREAKTDSTRKIISGILWKRLDQGWPLQVDATLQYSLGFNQRTGSWWTPPTSQDKNFDSPYNTYKYTGLPPAPICSPSLSSIKAALNPESSNYWFYLTDGEGIMHYATTLEAHNQNIRTYLH